MKSLTTKIRAVGILLLMAYGIAASRAADTELLANGSFESGFTGWNPTGNIDFRSNAPYLPTEGTKLACFNAGNTTPNGVLSQSFTTVPGSTCTLTFDAGALAYNNSQQKILVSVVGAGSLLSQTITITGTGNGSNNWGARSFTFVANSATSTLSFTDVSTTTNAIDLLLDRVSVKGPTGNPPEPVVRTLTIASSPDSLVAVSVSPADLNGNSSGSTQFTRSYNSGTSVILTAPMSSGALSFSKWQKNGADFSSSASTSLTLDADATFTAIYANAPASSELLVNGSFESGLTGWTPAGNLEVQSNSPYFATDGTKLVGFNGGNTTPNGVLSQSFATVQGSSYTLTFDAGALAYNTSQQKIQVAVTGTGSLLSQIITITGTGNGNNNWGARSFTFVANSSATTLTFTDVSTATAIIDLLLDRVSVKGPPGGPPQPPVVRTLTVGSLPSDGVAVDVSPADLNGSSSGSTPYPRSYNSGTSVTLTAPATSGSLSFSKWQKNGADFSASAAITLTLDADATLTAVYANVPPSSELLVNGSFESGLTGWNTTGNLFVQSGSPYLATDGTKLIGFNGGNSTPNAVLSQSFNTVQGSSYTLTFDAGALAYNNSQQKIQVGVTGSGSLLSQTITITGTGNGSNNWGARSFAFTANSATTTLTFTDVSPATNAIDLLLDHVSVKSAGGPPEPPVVRTLTVSSSPGSGVNVGVSPADLGGNSGGSTQFTRSYNSGSSVTLTAPTTSGSLNFSKWQKNGADFSTTPATPLTIDADTTFTAVYTSAPVNLELLVNGSFESDFTGWSKTGNLAIESNAPYFATDGTKLVGFSGGNSAPNGTLSQTITTVAGSTCTLTFDAGALAYNTSQQKIKVVVTGSGTLLTQTITITGTGNGNNNWSPRSFNFVANSSSSTVTFTDVSTSTLAIDLLLDHVSVKGPKVLSPQPDSVTIHAGQKVLIPVLENDVGGFDPASLEIVDDPVVGTATIDASGKILYAHSGADLGPVTFRYQISDNNSTSSPTTVTVNIADTLRIPSPSIKMPESAPMTAIEVVPAFPGLTFTKPVCFVSPPADTQRLFVGEIAGVIKVIPDVTAATPTASVVIDIRAAIATPARVPAERIDGGPDGECGLLGLAFHPNYAANGYFYVTYSVAKTGSTGWFQRLSRFTMPASQIGQAAPVADPASELIFLEQADRDDGHNGGDLHFGNDGYLYYAVGDEGTQYDTYHNSQRIDKNFFSAMMRIDVDKLPGNPEPNPHVSIPTDAGIARYSVPADNPFIGATTFNGLSINPATVRTEFWAVGFRSPWRFTYDEPTGELWAGDVGQDLYEEVDLITKGGNYGWTYRDGKHDVASTSPGTPPKPAGFTSLDPLYEYVHNSQPGATNYKGNCIIGGVVYRGTRIPSLTGSYIFGDQVSGNIWSLTRAGGVPGGAVNVQRIGGLAYVSNFGTDPSNKDVLISDYYAGRIMRIVATIPDGTFPTTLSATGLFADLSDLSPAPGVLPYEPILSFWSDHAIKHRWFSIPDQTKSMTWSRDGNWTFPAGQIWVKHFDLETERGNPETKKRIETRVLVRNPTGVYGVSYRWNEAQTEAVLADDSGEEFDVDVTVDGVTAPQRWRIPGRSDCTTCHTPLAGHALSFNTRQLNWDKSINGFTGNQIDTLSLAGYLTGVSEAVETLPYHVRPDETSHPAEERVRSYLAVNCAYCHQPDGPGSGWDGRAHLTLEETGLINGESTSALHPDDKLVVPGDPGHSIILSRMAASNDYSRMPPLATNVTDQVGIDLLTDWITNELPTHELYAEWQSNQFTVRSISRVDSGSSAVFTADGDPKADPDGDGLDNYTEYLLGSPPLSPSNPWQASMGSDGDSLKLRFLRKAHRIYRIDASEDMTHWQRWEDPANVSGYGTVDTWDEISIAPAPEGRKFFRFQVTEP